MKMKDNPMKMMFRTAVLALAMMAPNAMATDLTDGGRDDAGAVEPPAGQIETSGDSDIATGEAIGDCAKGVAAGSTVLGATGVAGITTGVGVVPGTVALAIAASGGLISIGKAAAGLQWRLQGIKKNDKNPPSESNGFDNSECNSIAGGTWWDDGWMNASNLASKGATEAEAEYIYAYEANHALLGDALRAADAYQTRICAGTAHEIDRADVKAHWKEYKASGVDLRLAFIGWDREVRQRFKANPELANHVITLAELEEGLAGLEGTLSNIASAGDPAVAQIDLDQAAAEFRKGVSTNVGQTVSDLWKSTRQEAMRDHSNFWSTFILPGV